MRTVTILRGLPGSGKSTFAGELRAPSQGATNIVSADEWFIQDGVYKFDPSQLSCAHRQCFANFMYSLQEESCDIIVDNTNLTAWECAPYVLAGETWSCDVEIVSVVCDFEKAFARQTHNVSRGSFDRMCATFASEGLPRHWKCRQVTT